MKSRHAPILQNAAHIVHVDTYRGQPAHDVGRGIDVGVNGPGERAVILERGDGRLGQGVDGVGTDEAVDV